MKTKQILSISILSLCMLSCNSETSKKDHNFTEKNTDFNTDEMKSYGKTNQSFNSTTQPNSQTQQNITIKFIDVKDTSNGLTLSSVPLPSSWRKENSGDFQFVGPNGMKILGIRSGDFSYSNDPQKINLFNITGKKIKQPQSMEQIIESDFKPNAAQYNRRLTKTYPIPEAAAFLSKFNDLLYKVDLSPKKFEAVGTEWEDPDGTSYLTIIIRHEEQGYDADSWGYAYDAVQSPKQNFEMAKRILINYLVNQEINMAWVNKVNGDLKQKIDASNAKHRAMMKEVERNMEVFQEGQKRRQINRDELNNRISNYILSKTDVINPETGSQANVAAGSTYYWINEKGEIITTEDYQYDPNTDSNYNKYRTWKRHQSKN